MELPDAKANLPLAARLNKVAWVVTILVLFIIGMMRRTKIDVGIDFSFLPPFHATLNGLCAVFLVLAFWYIKKGNIIKHRQMIYGALGLSALFLLSYVVYHFTTEETSYCKEGLVRSVYFFFLISHIITAGFILPFILFTFIRAYTNQFEKHKRMARYVFPVWLYVAITGPICYLMLQPCYQ